MAVRNVVGAMVLVCASLPTRSGAQDGTATATVAPVVVERTGPAAVVLAQATPAELRAHAIWTLRAGLNVAALQCQYSPFLRTPENYNGFLRQHARELSAALATTTAHFRRVDGAKLAQTRFDQYTTRSYNSFASLDAQLSFCDVAGSIGRDVLVVPKGQLAPAAAPMVGQLRAALNVPTYFEQLRIAPREWAMLPEIDFSSRR